MGQPIQVREFIPAFAHTYRSIDIRAAAVLSENEWTSRILVIRLTYEEPTAASERLARFVQSGEMSHETHHFRIVTEARPFSAWTDLCSELLQGALEVGGLKLRLPDPIPLEDQTLQLDRYPGYVRSFDGEEWPDAQVNVGHPHQPLTDPVLAKEMRSLGFSDINEPINATCEVEVGERRSGGYPLSLSAPVFLCLKDVQVSRSGVLTAAFRGCPKLSDVRVFLRVHDGNYSDGRPVKKHAPVPIKWRSSAEAFPVEGQGEADAQCIRRNDSIEIRFMHPLWELAHFRFSLAPPASSKPGYGMEPLFRALKRFCPLDEVLAVLTRPQQQEGRKLGAAGLFEMHATWFLALAGLSAIRLGEHEKLREGKIDRGTLDILAFNRATQTLYLVGCTLSAPNEADLNELLNIHGILSREVFSDTEVKIVPVIFSGAYVPGPYREHGAVTVAIVDRDRLRHFILKCDDGHQGEFFSFVDGTTEAWGKLEQEPSPDT